MSLPFRGGDQFTAAALRQSLNDSKLDERTRILAAMALASRQRIESGHKLSVPCLDFERAALDISARRIVCRLSAPGPAIAAERAGRVRTATASVGLATSPRGTRSRMGLPTNGYGSIAAPTRQ